MRRQSAHVDAEVLAELSAGLIDGKRATRIHAHLAGCQRCAQRSAALTEISAVLASVPSPRMPDAVFTRLNTALAQEAAHRSAPVTAEVRSGDRDSVNRESANSVVTFSHAAKGRRRGLASPVAARAFAAAAAACVVAAGGYAAVQLTSGGSPTASGVAAPEHSHTGAQAHGPSTNGPRALPFIPRTGTAPANGPVSSLAFQVVDSGIDYQTSSLGTQIKTELNKVVALKSATLHTPTSQQYACVSDVTGGSVPALVDKARFQGQPATIIAMSHVGNQVGQAWVVGPSCSASSTDILKHVSLPTSGG